MAADPSLHKAIQFAGDFTPAGAPTDDDWVHLERDLGLHFPADFKRFSSHFGSGRFGEDLYLLSPSAPAPQLRLCRKTLTEFQTDFSNFDHSFPLFPAPNPFVIVLTTTSRIHYALRATADRLSSELTRLHFSLLESEELHLPIAEFIVKAYEGALGADAREMIWTDSSPFFEPLAR